VTSVDSPARGWGLGDAVIGIVLGIVAANVAALLYLAASGVDNVDDASISVLFLLNVPLWVAYIGVPLITTGIKGRGPVEDLGLRFRPRDVPLGIALGAACQLVLPVVYAPILWLFNLDPSDVSRDANKLADKATGGAILLLVVMVAVVAPLAEELMFRGLLQLSLERRMRASWAILVQALVFAILHFQLVPLPGLFLFGVFLGYLAHRTGRLGLNICTHMGFNAWVTFAFFVLDWR
jgi:membrane protease YdiL (CAAX protease family)